jgi:hypothetical protein
MPVLKMTVSPEIPSDSLNQLVYAQVDPQTLSALDTCSDQQTMPRSWVIAQILQDWAAQRAGERGKTLAA